MSRIPLGILAAAGAAPAPAPIPAVVENSVVWMDAADLSTITESGGSVSQWDNKGSLGNFTQSSGALQPTTGASTLNGLNVIDFAADFMTSANTAATWRFLHDGTKYIVAAVWKPGTTSDPNTRYSLINTTFTSAAHGAYVVYDDRVSAGRNDLLDHFVGNGSGSTDTAPVSNRSSNGFLPPNTFSVMSVLADPSNGTFANRSELFRNAGAATKNNTSNGTPSTTNPPNTLEISASNSLFLLTGSIAELIIVSGTDATEGNRVIIRDYLNAKWGVYT